VDWINVERLLFSLSLLDSPTHWSARVILIYPRTAPQYLLLEKRERHPTPPATPHIPSPRSTMQHHRDTAPCSENGAGVAIAQEHPVQGASAAPAPTPQDDGGLDAQPEPIVEAVASPARSPRKRASESPEDSPRRKRVRWSTITVHEFGIGLGGSAISDRGGPPIGLANKPEFTWMTKVGEMAERSEGIHRFTPDQRTRLLKAAGISEGMISRYARETSIILKSRRKAIVEGVPESSDEEDSNNGLFEEEDDETEDSESDDDVDSYSRKRKAESQHSIYMNRSQFLPLRRPRMIPANYV
jgi:hypothetical protein